ncbi:hypothetical protein ACJX0J_026767 [Zea mays]
MFLTISTNNNFIFKYGPLYAIENVFLKIEFWSIPIVISTFKKNKKKTKRGEGGSFLMHEEMRIAFRSQIPCFFKEKGKQTKQEHYIMALFNTKENQNIVVLNI